MSDSPRPNALSWDQPPFTIDESPDPLPDAIAGVRETTVDFGPVRQDLSAIQDTLAGLQSAVERVGRELYKHTTRMETLFTQVMRLRADVTTLVETDPPENKIVTLLKALLPLLDGLGNIAAAARATAASLSGDPAASALTPLCQAVTIVQEKSLQILKDLGVSPMEAVGKPYDAHRQVVVDTTDNPDLPALLVVEEETQGYLYRDQVLRPAQVIVNKPQPRPAPPEPAPGDSTPIPPEPSRPSD